MTGVSKYCTANGISLARSLSKRNIRKKMLVYRLSDVRFIVNVHIMYTLHTSVTLTITRQSNSFLVTFIPFLFAASHELGKV